MTSNILIEDIDVDEPYINICVYIYLNLSNDILHDNQYEVLQLTLSAEEFHHSIGDLKYALAKLLSYYYFNIDTKDIKSKKTKISKFSKSQISFWTRKEIESTGTKENDIHSISDCITIKTSNNTNSSRTNMSQKEILDYINNRMCFVSTNSNSNTNQIQSHTEEDFKVASDELENWLTTDQIRIEQLIGIDNKHLHRNRTSSISINDADANNNVISMKLLLSPMVDMPTPIIRVAIVSIKKIVDGIVLLNNITNKSYVQYNLVVRQCRLEWIISRRFSDFVKLHRSLLAQDPSESGSIPSDLMPTLPSKYTNNKYVSCSDMVVNYRKKQLHAYLNRLLEFNRNEANHHLLRFLGLMNRCTGDENQAPNGNNDSEIITTYNDPITGEVKCNTGPRPLIHISKLQGTVRWGDIILFRCVNNISSLQRKITGSNWDHVGLVVSKDSSGSYSNSNNFSINDLYILESTAVGVTVFPLIPRLQAYHNTKFCEAIGLRCYYGLRTLEMYNNMISFVNVVNGAPYGFKLSHMLFTQEFHHHADTGNVGEGEVDMDACLPLLGSSGSSGSSGSGGSGKGDGAPKQGSILTRIYDSVFGCTRVESVDETASLPSVATESRSPTASVDLSSSVVSGGLFVDTHGKICRDKSDSSTDSSDRLNMVASSNESPPVCSLPLSPPLGLGSSGSKSKSANNSKSSNVSESPGPVSVSVNANVGSDANTETSTTFSVTPVTEKEVSIAVGTGAESCMSSPGVDSPTGNSSNHNPLLIAEMMGINDNTCNTVAPISSSAAASASASVPTDSDDSIVEPTVKPVDKIALLTQKSSSASAIKISPDCTNPTVTSNNNTTTPTTNTTINNTIRAVPATEKSTKSMTRNTKMEGNTNSAGSKKTSTASTATTYFCSELVAACLIAMCIIHESHNPAFFWPDSFAYNKYLDSCCVQHSDRNSIIMDDTHMNEITKFVSNNESEFTDDEEEEEDECDAPTNCIGYYGDELIIDCNVIEIAKAKTVNQYNLQKSNLNEKECNSMYTPSATFVPSI